ncbi:MAG: hypothetical protein HRU11_04760 [Parvularculaceae bacterium]|nr:hypothetical protein [Parvularculaceae bacterium]
MVDFMTEDSRARLQSAVSRAEKRTSAEIVVMVMRHSTDYRAVEFMAAAILAMALPAALLPFASLPALWIWLAQLVMFVTLAMAFPILRIGRFLVGDDRMSRDVQAAARAEFFAHGLRRTKQRAAVFLFVTIREQKVQVLYDDGAAAIVPEEAWGDLASFIATRMKAGDGVSGLEEAVSKVADLLESDLPPMVDDEDELPNVIMG